MQYIEIEITYINWVNQTNAWGGLLLSPFVVVASTTVPDSLGVIKHNEKLLLPMLFFFFFLILCLVLHSPLKFCRAGEVNKPLLILRYSMLGFRGVCYGGWWGAV